MGDPPLPSADRRDPANGGQLRVAIADDHYLVREGTRYALEDGDLEVVASVWTAVELEAAVASLRPDVVVTDIRKPSADPPHRGHRGGASDPCGAREHRCGRAVAVRGGHLRGSCSGWARRGSPVWHRVAPTRRSPTSWHCRSPPSRSTPARSSPSSVSRTSRRPTDGSRRSSPSCAIPVERSRCEPGRPSRSWQHPAAGAGSWSLTG